MRNLHLNAFQINIDSNIQIVLKTNERYLSEFFSQLTQGNDPWIFLQTIENKFPNPTKTASNGCKPKMSVNVIVAIVCFDRFDR